MPPLAREPTSFQEEGDHLRARESEPERCAPDPSLRGRVWCFLAPGAARPRTARYRDGGAWYEPIVPARGSVLTGAAGEDYVLYRLHLEGILAAPAPPGARIADLIVFDPAMSVGSMVQVKTRTR